MASLDTAVQLLYPSSLFYHWIWSPVAKNLNCENKKVLITGGSIGIGKSAVEQLVQNGCTDINIAARNEKAAENVFKNIRKSCKNKSLNLNFTKLDLASQKSSKITAEKLGENKFDVIILNAGYWPNSYYQTEDGIESTMAVNHFGHYTFLLTLLNKQGKQNHPQRIVVMTSTAHLACLKTGFQENYNEKSHYKSFRQYGNAKYCNLVFAKTLAKKLPHVQVNGVHPGVVQTDLFNNIPVTKLINWGFRSVYYGAQTTLYAGFSEDCKETGKFMANCENQDQWCIEKANDEKEWEKLWRVSKEVTGVDLD